MKTVSGRLSAEAKRANEAQQRAESLVKHLKSLGIDPEELGKDPRATFDRASKAYLQRQIEEATADPRDLAAQRAEEARAEAEARLQQYEQEQQRQQEQTQVAQRADQYASTIHQALEQSGLPRNPKTIARMAELMLAANRNGTRLHPNELAQRVAEQIFDEQSHHLQSLKGDGAAIAKWLGRENTEAVRKYLLQEAQSQFQQPQNTQRPREAQSLKPKTHHKYVTYDEVLEARRKGR